MPNDNDQQDEQQGQGPDVNVPPTAERGDPATTVTETPDGTTTTTTAPGQPAGDDGDDGTPEGE